MESVPSLVPFSLALALGFLATGGGIFAPLFTDASSLPTLVEDTIPRFFGTLVLTSDTGLVSLDSLLLLLEKIKLAVFAGDLGDVRRSGDVGECSLRQEAGFSFDLAAVLRRIASCRFMDEGAVVTGGDFCVGEGIVAEDVTGAKGEYGLGRARCTGPNAGGEVDVGEVMIKDFLMGFCGASPLTDEVRTRTLGSSFLMVTLACGCSSEQAGSGMLLTGGEEITTGSDPSCGTWTGSGSWF